MNIQIGVGAIVLALITAASGAAQTPDRAASQRIVFVCEHGAAKSVIAAAYFNKIAAERGLPDRAIYRGASPQAELSASALKGLREDGMTVPVEQPAALTTGDVSQATHIFAIGCSLPTHAVSSGKARNWSDVPDDKGYGPMRDAIKKHVEQLIDQLQKR
jgi:arsenate reductase